MKRTILLLAVLFSSFSDSLAQTEFDKLNKAYKKNSPELLNDFFEEWHKEIKPISDSEFIQLNDTIKEAYTVFESFYNTKNLGKFGVKSLEDYYQKIEFVIVQNSLRIRKNKKVFYTAQEIDSYMVASIMNNPDFDSAYKTKLLMRNNGKLSIRVTDNYNPYSIERMELQEVNDVNNFRPRVSIAKHLYFSQKFEQILDDFLSRKSVERRKGFLENYIRIAEAYIGLKLITFPEVQYIVFDEKMKYVQINYTIGSVGGRAFYKKCENEWVFIVSERTFVE